MTDFAAEAPPLPFGRTVNPLDPPPELGRWQRKEPVRPVVIGGVRAWLVTRYSDVRTLLTDPRLSCDPARRGYPPLRPDQPPPARGYLPSMDPPEHTRLRRIIMRSSLVTDVERLRPAIERHANELLDKLTVLPRPVDLVSQFAMPLPVKVICELVGVPFQDRAMFERCANTLASRSVSGEEVAAAHGSLATYLRTLINLRDREPGDDLLSDIVTLHVRAGRITLEDAVGLGLPLLIGGHASTAKQIAMSVIALLRCPDQAALLENDPRLLPGAVDELLRHQTVVHFGLRRVATEDIAVGETIIRAGEGVVLALQSANRDADVFPDPHRLDITRGARRHVAFGHGIHRCPGQALAKVELEVALSALVRRLPGLRLAEPFEHIGFDEDSMLYGVRELPVSWRVACEPGNDQ